MVAIDKGRLVSEFSVSHVTCFDGDHGNMLSPWNGIGAFFITHGFIKADN